MRGNHKKSTAKKLRRLNRVLALCFALVFMCSCLLPVFASTGGFGLDEANTAVTLSEVEEAVPAEDTEPAAEPETPAEETPAEPETDADADPAETPAESEAESGSTEQKGESGQTDTGSDPATPAESKADSGKADSTPAETNTVTYRFWGNELFYAGEGLNPITAETLRTIYEEYEEAQADYTDLAAFMEAEHADDGFVLYTTVQAETVLDIDLPKVDDITAEDGTAYTFDKWVVVDEYDSGETFRTSTIYEAGTDGAVDICAVWAAAETEQPAEPETTETLVNPYPGYTTEVRLNPYASTYTASVSATGPRKAGAATPMLTDLTDNLPEGTFEATLAYYDSDRTSVKTYTDSNGKTNRNIILNFGVLDAENPNTNGSVITANTADTAQAMPSAVSGGKIAQYITINGTTYVFDGAAVSVGQNDEDGAWSGNPVGFVTSLPGEYLDDGKPSVWIAQSKDSKVVSKIDADKNQFYIVLHYKEYKEEFNVNLTVKQDGSEITNDSDLLSGNTYTIPSTVTKNGSFNIQVSTRRGYTATVKNGNNTILNVGNGSTGDAQISDVTNDVSLTVEYTKASTVTFDPNVFQNQSYKYLYDNGTARFTTDNNRDLTADVNEDGATFTYTFTTKSTGITWQVDSMKINGVYLEIPARSQGSSATTTIVPSQNGESALTATLKVTSVSTNNQTGYIAYTYELTINGAFEDVTIDDCNLNNVTWAEVIPSATEGVTFENQTTGASGSGLNQPVQTESGTQPEFVFGLEDGFENLTMELYAYNSSGDQQSYSSGVTNNKINLPTTVNGSTSFYYSSGSGYWGSQVQLGTVTLNSDGTYTVLFNSRQTNNITLQLLKVSATPKNLTVIYDLKGGTLDTVPSGFTKSTDGQTVTDNNNYSKDNSSLAIAGWTPTAPESEDGTEQVFKGWKIKDDTSGTIYNVGTTIDLTNETFRNNYIDKTNNTLTFVAVYAKKTSKGDNINVPVNIYLDGEKQAVTAEGATPNDWDSSTTGDYYESHDSRLVTYKKTLTKDGKTYRLVYKYNNYTTKLRDTNVTENTTYDLYYTSTADVTLSKALLGNYADASEDFTFTVSSSTTSDTIKVNSETKTDNTFTLKGGESVTISGVTIGSVLTITEKQVAKKDGTSYTTTATGYTSDEKDLSTGGAIFYYLVEAADTPSDNSKYAYAIVKLTPCDQSGTPNAGADAIESSWENEGVTPNETLPALTVTNQREITPDTGIALDSAPFVLMLAIVTGGAVLTLRKKRS